MTSFLAREIASQPAEVARFIERHSSAMTGLAQTLPACSYALVAARGSSDHAATYARYVWGALAGLPVAPAAPSLHTLYGTPPRMTGALVVGISQSGQSPDVVEVVEEGRKQGRPTVAFTNDPRLAAGAHRRARVQPVRDAGARGGRDQDVHHPAGGGGPAGGSAASRPRSRSGWRSCASCPRPCSRCCRRRRSRAGEAAAELKDVTSFITLARGINLCTADELALKLRELLCLPTHGWSAADFRHGSIAMIVPGAPVLLIMPSGVGFADMQKLAQEVTDRGAVLTVISDDPAAAPMARHRLPLAAPVPEWLSPLTAVLAGQLLALELVPGPGLDPDRPRGLTTKVVKTF